MDQRPTPQRLKRSTRCATSHPQKPSLERSQWLRLYMADFDIQGHRGARGLLPENTVAGFLHALDLGVTTLEMDVVISKDNQVIVSHDPWFSAAISTDPQGQPIAQANERDHRLIALTADQIRTYDVGQRGHHAFPKQKPMPAVRPTLREVIAQAEAHAKAAGRPAPRYNIETKSKPEWDHHFTPPPQPFTELLYSIIEETGILARTTLQSFDFRTLRVAHKLDPTWPLAALVEHEADANVDHVIANVGCPFHTLSPYYKLVTPAMVRRCHALGLKVIPWTINESPDMRRLHDMGIDGLITDYPDIAVKLLTSPKPQAPAEGNST